MSLQFLLNNLHIAPFIGAFFVGLIFLVLAPLKYRSRTGKKIVTPFDLSRYNEVEKKLLTWAVVLVLGGILGAAIISEIYGYNYTFTDINGKTSIINSKEDSQYR